MDINKILNTYEKAYNQVFSNYYPAHGNTGFTEENQTVNFVKSVTTLYQEAFAWFEVPVGNKLNEHIDAVIFNPETKETFIIEAKRFTSPKQKLESVGNDIIKIFDKDNIDHIVENLPNADKYTYNCVILADVWIETTPKIELYQNWNYKGILSLLKKYKLNVAPLKRLDKSQWYQLEFNKEKIDKYKLLVLISTIS